MKIFKFIIPAFLLMITSCQPTNKSALNTDTDKATEASQKLNYKYTPSSTSTKTWVLIHGLGDDMSKLQSLADLAQAEGYSVLQMDLHGHGQTLFNYLNEHHSLPTTLDYEKNVVDIEKLIADLKIENQLIIVGHSYGGAIAYALAARIEKNKSSRIHSVHMLAPYVERIDKFLKTTYNPFRPPQLDQYTDPLLDPILDQYMQKTFREYLLKNYYGGVDNINAVQEAELNLRIEAAVKCTKGIRRFDLLEPSQKLLSINAPLQIIGAENDTVVTKNQLTAFDDRLTAAKVSHTLEFIVDKEVGHLFPRTMPDVVFKKINSFVLRNN